MNDENLEINIDLNSIFGNSADHESAAGGTAREAESTACPLPYRARSKDV